MNELSFAAMTADDLDWVAASEAELHAHPWSRGSFAVPSTSPASTS